MWSRSQRLAIISMNFVFCLTFQSVTSCFDIWHRDHLVHSKKVQEVIEKLNNKADFDELARDYSKDQPDLGYFTEDMMVPEFSSVVFAMDKGTYSQEPVKTEFGYHVIYVEDIRDSQPLDFKAVEPQIRNNLSQKAVDDVINDLQRDAQIEKFDLEGNKIKEESAK